MTTILIIDETAFVQRIVWPPNDSDLIRDLAEHSIDAGVTLTDAQLTELALSAEGPLQ